MFSGVPFAVLFHLETRTATFTELWSLLPGIATKELTDALRELRSAALVERTGEPPHAQYGLTSAGRAAMPLLRGLRDRVVDEMLKTATAEEALALCALLDPAASHGPSRTTQVKRSIRTLIDRGLLREGDRVPSARRLADILAMSVFHVKRAYDELVEEGVLTSQIRSGTFVGPPKN